MILSNLASPLALAMFFFQDDPSAPSVPVGSPGSALVEMVRNSGPVAFGVLVILLVASIFSWAIMFSKWRRFSAARKQSQGFLRAFRKSGRLSEIATVADQFQPSPLVSVFTEINDEYQRQSGGRGMPRNPTALERAAQTASSEALIPTAAGLAVAIPAVVGYNQLTAQLRDFAARMDDFGRELLNAIENAAMLAPPAVAPPPPEELIAQPRRRTF